MKKENQGLLILIAFILGCSGLFFLFFGIGFVTYRFHPLYKEGMALARNDPNVIELFGSPVRGGLFVPGTEQVFRYGDRIANLETPISGPEARGFLGFYGTKDKDGPWQLLSMSIHMDDGELVLTYDASEPDKGFQPVRSKPALDNHPPASPTPPPEEEAVTPEPTEIVE